MKAISFLSVRRAKVLGAGGGFTLLEMLIALSVFILLSGAMLGVVMATIRTSNALREEQLRQESTQALADFIRHKLGHLTPETQIMSWRPESSTVAGLLFGENDQYDALEVVPGSLGAYTLCWTQVQATENPPPAGLSLVEVQSALLAEGKKLYWRPLLENLSGFSFEFAREDNSEQVLDQWTEKRRRPDWLRMKLTFMGQDQPVVLDFQVPAVIPPGRKVISGTGEL